MISNDELLERRRALRLAKTAPQVGDYVLFPEPGGQREERIAHDWGPEIGFQTTRETSGSFYLGDGYASFSGGLEPGIVPGASLADTGGTREGGFWFFSGDYRRAHNGVDVLAPCRVYRYEPPDPAKESHPRHAPEETRG
jgi:hypothetical protein